MFSDVDKRALYLFAPVFAIAIPTVFFEESHPAGRVLYPALYVSWIVLGGGLAYFDLKEGYCMNRTTVTREASPILFWLEVGVAFLAICLGVRALANSWL